MRYTLPVIKKPANNADEHLTDKRPSNHEDEIVTTRTMLVQESQENSAVPASFQKNSSVSFARAIVTCGTRFLEPKLVEHKPVLVQRLLSNY